MELKIDTEPFEEALKEVLRTDPEPPTVEICGRKLSFKEILEQVHKRSELGKEIIQQVINCKVKPWKRRTKEQQVKISSVQHVHKMSRSPDRPGMKKSDFF